MRSIRGFVAILVLAIAALPAACGSSGKTAKSSADGGSAAPASSAIAPSAFTQLRLCIATRQGDERGQRELAGTPVEASQAFRGGTAGFLLFGSASAAQKAVASARVNALQAKVLRTYGNLVVEFDPETPATAADDINGCIANVYEGAPTTVATTPHPERLFGDLKSYATAHGYRWGSVRQPEAGEYLDVGNAEDGRSFKYVAQAALTGPGGKPAIAVYAMHSATDAAAVARDMASKIIHWQLPNGQIKAYPVNPGATAFHQFVLTPVNGFIRTTPPTVAPASATKNLVPGLKGAPQPADTSGR